MTTQFEFSAGPWNISTGADPFGPPVRDELTLARKMEILRDLGYGYMQFHDDDAVPDSASQAELVKIAGQVRKMLDDHGLKAEFVAPRIWEDPRTIDGAITNPTKEGRDYATRRGLRSVDIANILGCRKIVLWPAREGTYIREMRDPIASSQYMLDFINALLAHDKNIRILGEMKPNEPMDHMFLPTTGHMLAMCYKASDPNRVGALIESAHAILAGLDPSEEMGYALWHKKLWGVHLNDQNGLKFDQDKTFGSVNLRRALNQVDVLMRGDYGKDIGEAVIGFDAKPMRTQPAETSHYHLRNNKEIFERLVAVAQRLDRAEMDAYRAARDYEGLELYMVKQLLGA